MLPASTRFNQCRSSRSSWLIAIRSILQPCGCQEELSTWLKAELSMWPRHDVDVGQGRALNFDIVAHGENTGRIEIEIDEQISQSIPTALGNPTGIWIPDSF